jgi:hypothetical protein
LIEISQRPVVSTTGTLLNFLNHFSMNPKSKAAAMVKEIDDLIPFDSTLRSIREPLHYAKKLALKTVDEILKALKVPPIADPGHMLYDSQLQYWEEVMEEIEKI